jgi:heat shock protein HslJ
MITALATLSSCHSSKQSTTGNASIVGKYWKLVEVNGKPIAPAEQSKREPHMILNAAENKVSGSGGCNSFFGNYELQSEYGISFSKIGSTKMACPGSVMQSEQQLFQAFQMANKFTLQNDILILFNSGNSPLAKFVVSDMK